MDLTEQRVAMALAPRPTKFFRSVASTNDIGVQWLKEGALKGAVVVADEQTAGRGRMGRTWYTPPNVAIAASVLLRIDKTLLPQVNMAGTLAVSNLLQALNIADVTIKWSNDVLVDGKKICGILPEAVWQGDTLDGVVLGMGVNVRNDFSDTPLANTATTIEALTGKTQDRAALLAVLLFHLDDWLGKLGTSQILNAYKAQMTMLGHPIEVQRSDEVIAGKALDVLENGGLVIEREDRTTITVFAGDVTVVSGRYSDGN